MKPPFRDFAGVTGLVLLRVAHTAVAHRHDDMAMNMTDPAMASSTGHPAVAEPISYFQLSENSGFMLAHIALMALAWVFVLPIGK